MYSLAREFAVKGQATGLHRDAALRTMRAAREALSGIRALCGRVTHATGDNDGSFDKTLEMLDSEAKSLAMHEDALGKERFTVLVCGTIKAGKSTLLNAVLANVGVSEAVRLPTTTAIGTSHLVELQFQQAAAGAAPPPPTARLRLLNEELKGLTNETLNAAADAVNASYTCAIDKARSEAIERTRHAGLPSADPIDDPMVAELTSRLSSVMHFHSALASHVTGAECTIASDAYTVPTSPTGRVPLSHFALADFAMPADAEEPLYQRVVMDVAVTVPVSESVRLPVSYALVDSPGVNGVALSRAHRARTYAGIDRASVCLTVVDVINFQSTEVSQVLNELRSRGKAVVVAINKIETWGAPPNTVVMRQTSEQLAFSAFAPFVTRFVDADGENRAAVQFVSARLAEYGQRLCLPPRDADLQSDFDTGLFTAIQELKSLASMNDSRANETELKCCLDWRKECETSWQTMANRKKLGAILLRLSRITELWNTLNAVMGAQQAAAMSTMQATEDASLVLQRIVANVTEPLIRCASSTSPPDVSRTAGSLSTTFLQAASDLSDMMVNFDVDLKRKIAEVLSIFDAKVADFERKAQEASVRDLISTQELQEITESPEELTRLSKELLLATTTYATEQLKSVFQPRMREVVRVLLAALSTQLSDAEYASLQGACEVSFSAFDACVVWKAPERATRTWAEFSRFFSRVNVSLEKLTLGFIELFKCVSCFAMKDFSGGVKAFGEAAIHIGPEALRIWNATAAAGRHLALQPFKSLKTQPGCQLVRSRLEGDGASAASRARGAFVEWSNELLNSLLTVTQMSRAAVVLAGQSGATALLAEARSHRSALLQCMHELTVANQLEGALSMALNGTVREREGHTPQDVCTADVIAYEARTALQRTLPRVLTLPRLRTDPRVSGAALSEQLLRQLLDDRRALLSVITQDTPGDACGSPILRAADDVLPPGGSTAPTVQLGSGCSRDAVLSMACAAIAAAAVYHPPISTSSYSVQLSRTVLDALSTADLSATVVVNHFVRQDIPVSLLQWGVYTVTLAKRSTSSPPPPLATLTCIAFCGTHSIFDAIVDAAFTTMGSDFPAAEGLQLHSGFASSLMHELAVIDKALVALDPTCLPTYVTGHSLGGAHAQLFALLSERATTMRVVTFGAPLIWAPAPHASSVNPVDCAPLRIASLAKRLHAVVHGDDIVPRLLGHTAIDSILAVLLHVVSDSFAKRLRRTTGVIETYRWMGTIFRLESHGVATLELEGRNVGGSPVLAIPPLINLDEAPSFKLAAVSDFLRPVPSINMVEHHGCDQFYVKYLVLAAASVIAK